MLGVVIGRALPWPSTSYREALLALEHDAGHAKVSRRHGDTKAPRDSDRPLSAMLDVVRLAEKEVGRSGSQGGDLLRASEEEDMAAVDAMVRNCQELWIGASRHESLGG